MAAFERPGGPVRVVETHFEGDVAFGRLGGKMCCWITAVRYKGRYYICVPGMGTHLVAADNLTDTLHYCAELLSVGVPLTEAYRR